MLRKWQSLRIDAVTAPKYFNGAKQNIGVILGDDAGSADVDCDCDEAITVAKRLLPPTNMVFGRMSKPFSHYFFRCRPPSRVQEVQ